MQIESTTGHTIELMQAPLGIAPEALNAIDVMRPAHELVLTVIDSKVFRITDINQAVITAPTGRMDDRVQGHATANYGLKCAFPAIRHDFGVDTAVALEDAEDDGLARGTTATLASDSTSA